MQPRWGFWNNYLVGIPWERWRALRAENQVDAGYRHRAACLAAFSVLNSLHRRQEERRFGAAVAGTRLDQPPLFILGHWRSGTTYLHGLLACETEQFAFPNSIQACYPHTFLCRERAIRRQFAAFVPRTRPMDDVAVTPETPQEDEFALCAASLRSSYLGVFSFPRRVAHYDRYLTFRGVPGHEIEEWKSAFLHFLKKLTLQHSRRLLLKSPTHTARIRLLLALFPDARFVAIHRDPYAVFQSSRHLFQRLVPLHTLQKPTADPDDQILRRYTRLYDAYFEEKALIPEGHLHEIRFEELERDPVGQIAATYERLGLTGFVACRPRLQQYVDSLAGYRRNRFTGLSANQRARVAAAWQRSFDMWGYPV